MGSNTDWLRFEELVRNAFLELVSTKTGWGKNELELLLEKAFNKALGKMLERSE